jgi:sodium transport system permease protein
MTWLLTKSPRRTLQLGLPRPLSAAAAGLLALAIYPAATIFQLLVAEIYELPPQLRVVLEAIEQKFAATGGPWLAIVLLAIVPAICEELTYRGFILSGLRRSGHHWRAIVISSLFFAVTHAIMQQQVNAFFLGLVLGYLAIQTGSIWPCIVYHLVHNTTACLVSSSGLLEKGLLKKMPGEDLYAAAAFFCSTLLAVALLFWFSRLRPREAGAANPAGPIDPAAIRTD